MARQPFPELELALLPWRRSMTVAEIMRRSQSAATMTRKVNLAIVIILGSVSPVFAQESATPALTPAAGPIASATATRSVRITFVPPPIQGTISLGIYDENAKLVRVLEQEAELDQFEVGDDGLTTRWDGKDDDGYDVPAGTYHARGYSVAPMKIEQQPITGGVMGPPT